MLSARQVISIATLSKKPPLRLSHVTRMYKMKSVSLRSINKIMEQQKMYFLCEFRDTFVNEWIPLLVVTPKGLAISDYPAFYERFMALQPSKATLLQLSKIVNAVGGSIKYVSSDWRRVGIEGTMASLARVSVSSLDKWLKSVQPESSKAKAGALQPQDIKSGLENIAGGVVAGAATAVAVVKLPEELFLVVLSLGAITTAYFIGEGIHEMYEDNPNVSTNDYYGLPPGGVPQVTGPPFDPLDAGTSTIAVLPQPPTDAGASGIPTLQPVDVSNLPESPPATASPGNPSAGDAGVQPPSPPTPPGGMPTPPPAGGPPTPVPTSGPPPTPIPTSGPPPTPPPTFLPTPPPTPPPPPPT